MAIKISGATLDRALTGVIRGGTFVEAGADFRRTQTSVFQKFLNMLGRYFIKDFELRRASDVARKEEFLAAAFFEVATQILKAEPGVDNSVAIDFDVAGKTFYVTSDWADEDRLCISEGWFGRKELEFTLPELKGGLLIEYIRCKRIDLDDEEQIDLTAFNLDDVDFRGIDLRNCLLPDLRRSKLNGAMFDRTTRFRQVEKCVIGEEAFDRLLENRAEAAREFAAQRLRMMGLPPAEDVVAVARTFRRKLDSTASRFWSIMSSEDPAAWYLKGTLLRTYTSAYINTQFKLMRDDGVRINLSEVDFRSARLSDIDFSGADLSAADFSGSRLVNINMSKANLTGANFRSATLKKLNLFGADLFFADFSHAFLSYANFFDADLRGAKLRGARIGIANGARLHNILITQRQRNSDDYVALLSKSAHPVHIRVQRGEERIWVERFIPHRG